MKVLRLRSWNFHAPNLDAMTRFYQLALGAELAAQQTLAGVKVNRLRAGETGLGLFDASEKQFPGVPHHTFDIDGPTDAKDLIKELEAKGIKSKGRACMAKVRAIRCTSPTRTVIALSCPKIRIRAEDRRSRIEDRLFRSSIIHPRSSTRYMPAIFAASQRAVRSSRASP